MLFIPDSLHDIYPNPVQMIGNTPVVIFRDHRWTLPVMAFAATQGLLRLPVTVIGFDRHPDALVPACGHEILADYRSKHGSFKELIHVVKNFLSPRDDDWIYAGMELGIIGNMISFSSNLDDRESTGNKVNVYNDSDGIEHRFYRIERPHRELSFKGAFVDPEHPIAEDGLWHKLGWNPVTRTMVPPTGQYVLDIDLDYWTIAWDTYTFPFPTEVFEGEFGAICQSQNVKSYPVRDFFDMLVKGALLITIATEPGFCGGEANSRTILGNISHHLFCDGLMTGNVAIDYFQHYPNL